VSFAAHVAVTQGSVDASQIVCGAPPSTATRVIFPPAKKPSERLSGDQNGFEAPSLPATGRSVGESSARKNSRGPLFVVTAIANVEPSGEITDETPRMP
jgi:hypothetical protein